MVAAVNHFDAYLVTHPFSIETDHRALMFLNYARHSNGRLARWAIQLQPYSYKIRYRPGSENDNADVLSRMCEEEEDLPLLRPSVNDGGGEMLCGHNMEQAEKDRGRETKKKTRRRSRETC